MNIKKTVMALAAVFTLSLASAVYAADNGTEFGIEDDLTVLGTGGLSTEDPDVEIKGFTVFGATQAAPALNIPLTPGNIFANGYVQVSSGMYVAGSSTFTAGLYSTGISSFAAGPGSIYIPGGSPGQVLKKVGGSGVMEWANDSVGLDGTSMGDPRYLQMPNAGETALENSSLRQDTGETSITLMGLSSMTVTGALAVHGAANFGGAVNLGDEVGDAIAIKGAATAEQGLSITGGDLSITNSGKLGVSGDADLDARLNVDLASTFGSSITAKGALDVTGAAVLRNVVHSSGTFTVGEGDETNFTVNAADGNTAIAGTLGVTGDLAVNTNKFNVAALTGDTLVAGTFGLTGKATLENDLLVKGSAQLGDATTDDHGINTAAEDGVALKVAGEVGAGKYVAKFYSGDPAVPANLAAWIKRK